jgi:DNA-directed RNA polymerase subunit RPC12/RpoP
VSEAPRLGASAAPRLTVSTNCPNCGAAIDFGEGTNALECDHCRSHLLVTGHGRVLSYFVSPKLEAELAISIARFAEADTAGPVRAGDVRLVFLPYYRVTATDLRWQRPEPERREEPPDPSDYDPDDFRIAALMARLAERDLVDDIECRDRAIERNFLAIDFPSPSLYSLGMRPNALRLELYRSAALAGLGSLVGAEIAADAALEIGRKTGQAPDIACRAVVGAVLSIVYFPFWLVEIRRPQSRSLTIIDAVSQAIVERGLRADLLQRLDRPATGEPSVVGFRPLVCPNCGWNLPVEPEHVIFYCGSCSRAWRIVGDDLVEMSHRFAGPREAVTETAAEHLPFWALRASIGDGGSKPFLIPAFRHRRARSLVELATSLSELAPPLASTATPPRARGGYFDENDAASLALFAHAGAAPRSFERAERCRGESIRVEENELVWIPFLSDSYSLRDPFRGTAIVRKLLL